MSIAAPPALEEQIKEKARSLGFELVGITTADPADTGERYAEWVDSGHAGEMGYMTRDPDRRRDPERVLSGARSIVVVGINYRTEEFDREGSGPSVFGVRSSLFGQEPSAPNTEHRTARSDRPVRARRRLP
jgi:epoxyqueuosine reductase QueG